MIQKIDTTDKPLRPEAMTAEEAPFVRSDEPHPLGEQFGDPDPVENKWRVRHYATKRALQKLLEYSKETDHCYRGCGEAGRGMCAYHRAEHALIDDEKWDEPVVKPPLGLMPRSIHRRRRVMAITDAILRYNEAGAPVPPEWLDELSEMLIKADGDRRAAYVSDEKEPVIRTS